MLALIGGILCQELDHQFDVDGDFSNIHEAMGLVTVSSDIFIIKPLERHTDDVAVGQSERVAVRVHFAKNMIEPGHIFLFHGYHELERTNIVFVLDLGLTLHGEKSY